MISPFVLPPHPLAQTAAQKVINQVHQYMRFHPQSELHRHGKMFGVLVYEDTSGEAENSYIAAFSAQLDGSYIHEGFVPPVYMMTNPPIGKTKEESQRLQRILFANYQFTNGLGEIKNALDIFASEPSIISPEEWFSTHRNSSSHTSPLPPSGTGECCAPKLLQYALTHHLKPIALAEFWIGAPSQTEIRHEGTFYAPCSGRCKPILRHMLRGITVTPSEQTIQYAQRCRQIDILFEDPFLMVVNKPSGVLSVPGKSDEPSVASYLAQNHNLHYLQAVHRLDQDTCGLLVLAKTPEVYKTLQAYFQRRDILKRYEAVLSAPLKEIEEEGVISLPLLPNPYDRPRQMVSMEHGKAAITRYHIRQKRPDGTILIDFFPLTGRTHQLRVHAAHPDGLNAPIIGDRLYGKNNNCIIPLPLHLCASEITFMHPINGQTLHFCIPSPFENDDYLSTK